MFLPQTPTCYSSQRDKKENTAILTDGKPQKNAFWIWLEYVATWWPGGKPCEGAFSSA